MASNVLILGTKKDPHVQRVHKKILAMGGQACVLDHGEDCKSSLDADENGDIKLDVDHNRVNSHWTIWYRVKLFEGSPFFFSGDLRLARFRANEWRAFYNLICGTFDSSTVNSLSAKQCLIKPLQQKIAAAAGFKVPHTTVSTSKQCFLDHATKFPESVIKPLGSPHIDRRDDGKTPEHNLIMTSKVGKHHLEEAPEDAFASCPQMLQQMIPKDHELRVVVVGNFITGFAINSQKYKISQVDWRYGTQALEFKPVTLSTGVKKQIQAFMKMSGLFTGSLDLIVDEKKQVWFIEINHDGQWAWLDDIVDGQISAGFARELLRHHPEESSPPLHMASKSKNETHQ